MQNTGKAIRLERIFNRNTKRTIIVPMDHGVSVGPIKGIEDIRETVTKMANGGANAGLVHKGLPSCGHRQEGADFGLIVHLSASTNLSPFPNAKVLVCTVEEAIRLGADAVSVHCNIGDETEARMLEDLGRVSGQAAYWGMPLLAMVYARGPKVPDEYDPDVVAHCARVGMELGADVVKVNYTGDPESFRRVTGGLAIPAVIAGGPKMDSTEAVLRMVYDSLQAGGSGLSIGRNVFQHKNPTRMVKALHSIVHEYKSVEDALAWLGEDANP
ncbi:MAG: fructose-bisphosphate aldolase, class [Desulfovibrionales bacterium]|jgi:class I fructose-bisphosphate aldolase|nr:fructose-bisphosphate aldolase, class [Desulfovibrionales bacterium]